MEVMKPCPFCGEILVICRPMYGNITGFECPTCGAIISFIGKESRKSAVEAWNGRIEK